jgi:hypothetical protein
MGVFLAGLLVGAFLTTLGFALLTIGKDENL